ncbi:hypothetical protein FHT05_001898 [Xanthomonas arboricola]|uniref:hypothetical protein n=1 Tax=Xanthomonas arboricola TaxID=56448 RepID=UPI0011B0E730|nr:hypothetical protein [Xanthomonas arboricola]MBB6257314.1 hypothetical protein [Xanthomonas arboricola]
MRKKGKAIIFFTILTVIVFAVLLFITNGRAAKNSIDYVNAESVEVCKGEKITSVHVKMFPVRIKVVGESGYAELVLAVRCGESKSATVKVNLKKKVGRWCVTDSSVNGTVKRDLDFCEK